ncbi:hypothetical protein [Alteromonas ponticola]|uniref:DUF3313 domain-containing protein n=1 Tax=Alteromonas ponticola TaxID=2720613 RepID=A0ABX1R4A7_9ALTE|nr:hypothetical protein [Alteromonas ponticola]NMH61274.1 hypothetical protein [Alteromonas ponticola]
MNLLKKIKVGSLAALALSGCAMTSEPYSIDTASSNIKPKKFIFKNVEMDGYDGLTATKITPTVERYIEDNAAFYKCRSSLFGSNCSQTSSSGIKDTWGSNVSRTDSSYTLTYFSDKKYSTGRVDKATIEQTLPFTVDVNEDAVTLTLSPPSAANAKPTSDALGLPYAVPISDKNVVAWTASLFEDSKTVSIKQNAAKAGEFDVELDPNSVRANLMREFDLELSESTDDILWKASTTRQLGDAKVHIDLTVGLYRGNTKVEYTIKHPFNLNSDGTISAFNADIIEIALKQIKDAANA